LEEQELIDGARVDRAEEAEDDPLEEEELTQAWPLRLRRWRTRLKTDPATGVEAELADTWRRMAAFKAIGTGSGAGAVFGRCAVVSEPDSRSLDAGDVASSISTGAGSPFNTRPSNSCNVGTLRARSER